MDKTLSMILAGSAIFVFSACQVDSDYNLEKLDTKVTILKNAEFPVPVSIRTSTTVSLRKRDVTLPH